MNLVRDVLDTCRAAAAGSGASWYVQHALGALLVCCALLLVAGWLVLSGEEVRGLALLALAALAFGYWRFLLPKALWHSKVERTLHGN